jgi:hypothetical protein
MIEDAADDDSAPSLDELKRRAWQLRGANPVPERYRGKKGEALRELAEIETRLQQDLCIKDLISIRNQLERLNGTYVAVRDSDGRIIAGKYQPGLLGVEQFFRAKGRRSLGANSLTLDHALDSDLLHTAHVYVSQGQKFGAALRAVVTQAKSDGRLRKHSEIETIIKRLRRKAERQRTRMS